MATARKIWTWLPSLFGAEEIPAAMVTYVSLLMFLQIGITPTVATCYCGCLFLPWVLKSFMRSAVADCGYYRRQLQICEFGLVASFLSLTYVLRQHSLHPSKILLALMLVSLLTAWHELAARMYYESLLYNDEQRHYNTPKIFFTQLSVVLTYGLLIVAVGALQVLTRYIVPSWAIAFKVVACIFFCIAVYHLFVLRRPLTGDKHHHSSMLSSARSEMHVISRVKQKHSASFAVCSLALLLLPQSLMFFSRVLFLQQPLEHGGLACTIQEIGLAQGTVGVLAFSLGLAFGRMLYQTLPVKQILWPMILAMGFSPVVYLTMTYVTPTSLWWLCVATMIAQFCFGFGLPLCMHFVRYISGERYRNTINYLYIPLVAAVMLIPMGASGWLVASLGFQDFFWLDVASSGAVFVYFLIFQHETIRLGSNTVLR